MEDSAHPPEPIGDPEPVHEAGSPAPADHSDVRQQAGEPQANTAGSAPGAESPGPVAPTGPTGPPADEGTKGLNDEDGGPAADERWAYDEGWWNDRRVGFAGVDLINLTRVRSIRGGRGPMAVGSGAQAIGALHQYGAKPDVARVGGFDAGWLQTAVDLHATSPSAERERLERLETHK